MTRSKFFREAYTFTFPTDPIFWKSSKKCIFGDVLCEAKSEMLYTAEQQDIDSHKRSPKIQFLFDFQKIGCVGKVKV